ncbi:MAG: RlmE family RNA methyltransferase [Desulfamplus sp.]|nr:RlmE family RNA methyltransferase [Desulfamplus sp.]MBF0209986.1 RlmE family RNA methyltransferase [Desulfamplus sp.]
MSKTSKSNQQWADHFTEKAKHDNYPARSVYKLMEIQKKLNIIKRGDFVLDLGCAPGSWLIYAAKTIGDKGEAVGVDLQKVDVQLPSNATAIEGDIFDLNQVNCFGLNSNSEEEPNSIKKYDVVLSDMAPSTTGRRDVDAARSFELCNAALNVASEWLNIGGNFVCKIFHGSDFKEFEKSVKANFKQHTIFKPESCRKASKEIYIIGRGKI